MPTTINKYLYNWWLLLDRKNSWRQSHFLDTWNLPLFYVWLHLLENQIYITNTPTYSRNYHNKPLPIVTLNVIQQRYFYTDCGVAYIPIYQTAGTWYANGICNKLLKGFLNKYANSFHIFPSIICHELLSAFWYLFQRFYTLLLKKCRQKHF